MPDRHRYASTTSSTVNRRNFIRAAGTAGIIGLAGCSGNGGDGNGNGGNGDGSTSGSGDDLPHEGVEFEFWDTFNVNTSAAQGAIEDLIAEFEEDTGASITVNWSGYQQLAGTRWLNAFENGEYPTLYLSELPYSGRFFDWLLPYSEWKDQLPSEVTSQLEWLNPILESAAGPLEASQYEAPVAILAQCLLVNTSHMEEAGLDPDEDFPPESYEEEIQLAQTLQEDGPADYALEMTGSTFDHNDFLDPYWFSESTKGKINDDWTDTNWNSDAAIQALERMRQITVEHDLSSPEGPTTDFEPRVPSIGRGDISMTRGNSTEHGNLLNQTPDMIESGELRWGASYTGSTGNATRLDLFTLGITTAPDGADKDEWSRKQDAAIDFVGRLLSRDFQFNLPQTVGHIPARKDPWEASLDDGDDYTLTAGDSNNHYTQAFWDTIQSADNAWSYHPETPNLYFNLPANHIQSMLRGEISAEEAANSIYEECRSVFDS
jgi:hypothetical protein